MLILQWFVIYCFAINRDFWGIYSCSIVLVGVVFISAVFLYFLYHVLSAAVAGFYCDFVDYFVVSVRV